MSSAPVMPGLIIQAFFISEAKRYFWTQELTRLFLRVTVLVQ